MFGYPMRVEKEGIVVILRPLTTDDLPVIAKGFGSLEVAKYLAQYAPKTIEDEREWYEKMRTSNDDVVGGIEHEELVGITGLHHLFDLRKPVVAPTSGIAIWNKSLWGRGVASRSHMARTLYAANHLYAARIDSTVRTVNVASIRALERVGYTKWGEEPRSVFREGMWLDTYHLTWFHPDRVREFWPEGEPEIYKEGLRKAREALGEARKVVNYI